MKNILAIYSSLSGDNSVSNTLAKNWVSKQEGQVVERDLSTHPVPHLDTPTMGAFFTPAENHTAEQTALMQLSEQLIRELEVADTLVIAVPMYNFGIPSTLKAWIDHVARAGKTFHYTAQGPEGLLTGKKAVIVTSRGGIYKETGFDNQAPFIKQVLNFIGISDVSFIYAEGTAMGDIEKQKAVLHATESLERIVA